MKYIDLGDRQWVRVDHIVAVHPSPFNRDRVRVLTSTGESLATDRSVAEIMSELATIEA